MTALSTGKEYTLLIYTASLLQFLAVILIWLPLLILTSTAGSAGEPRLPCCHAAPCSSMCASFAAVHAAVPPCNEKLYLNIRKAPIQRS